MFEGNSADMCAGKFPLVSLGGRAEGLACADPRARTPIGDIVIFKDNVYFSNTSFGRSVVVILKHKDVIKDNIPVNL